MDNAELLQKQLQEAERKIAYYEEPLPIGSGNCYHRFTDEGVCIRCGEDAEEWEAGCVEEIVDDLRSICHPEFVTALERLIHDKIGGPIDTIVPYLERIRAFSRQFAWEEGDPSAMDVVERSDVVDDEQWSLSL